MEFSELFVFMSFGIVQFPKFGNFSEISVFFELVKISRKSSEISPEINGSNAKKPVFEGFGV